jgi:hypothetical protein
MRSSGNTMAAALALVLSLCSLPSLVAALAAGKPHVFFLLVDDYGWAGAGWHNKVLSSGQREVQTPHMDKLVATGIELNHHCERSRLTHSYTHTHTHTHTHTWQVDSGRALLTFR